jgi:hypothetical protein
LTIRPHSPYFLHTIRRYPEASQNPIPKRALPPFVLRRRLRANRKHHIAKRSPD